MPHNGQSYLKQKRYERMVQKVRDSFQVYDKFHNIRTPTLADYETVTLESTHGTYSIIDMLDEKSLINVAKWYAWMKRVSNGKA